MNRPKRAAVKDIDINIADILGQEYRHRIDIGDGDIDPHLVTESMIRVATRPGLSGTSRI